MTVFDFTTKVAANQDPQAVQPPRLVLRLEADGQCTYAHVNEAAVQYTGLSRGEMIGRTVHEVYCPDMAREIEAGHRRCVESGTVVALERTRAFPTGRKIFDVRVSPIRGADDSVQGIEVVARDVTGTAA